MFVNTHLAIERDAFRPRLSQSFAAVETVPDVAEYASMIERVGGPWGWMRRPKYQDPASRLIGARYFRLMKGSDVVGYSLTRPARSLSATFNAKAVEEIENFGLLPEHNGKGYGTPLLHAVFAKLFTDSEAVYLTTRSTNHPGVVRFYERAGMRFIGREAMADDLLPMPKAAFAA